MSHFSNSINYVELKGSPSHDVSNDKPMSRRKFLVNWSDALAFCNGLTGSVTVTRGWMLVNAPVADPERPGLTCTRCSIEGLGACSTGGSGLIEYQKARVEATFELVEKTNEQDQNRPNPETITIVTEKSTGNLQVYTRPGDKLIWKGGSRVDKPVGDDATTALLVPGKTITYDVQFWFDPPIDLMDDSCGKVNSRAVTIMGKPYKKETLMFMPASLTRQYTTDGVSAWQATITLNWKRQTWQTLWQPDDQAWILAQTSGGKKQCEVVDFSRLFPRGFV